GRPGAAEPAADRGGERPAAVVHEPAFPSRLDVPRPGLEELVARAERKDVDRREALELRAAPAVMAQREAEELDLRAAHVAFVGVENVVIRRAHTSFGKVAAGLPARAQCDARGCVPDFG